MTFLVFFFADLSAPAAVLFGVGATATISVPVLLGADADLADFDPRPAVRRCIRSVRVALEAGPLTPLWETAIDAGHSLNRIIAAVLRHVRTALRPSVEACRDLAALLILLTTSPKGAMA